MHIDVPTPWSNSLLDRLVAQANHGDSFQIYGALPDVFPTGRPDDVPRINRQVVTEHFQYARDLSIQTNYLLNGLKGSRFFSDDSKRMREYFTWITRDLCPDIITVSDPELQRTLNREFGWESFCVSTISAMRDKRGVERWLETTKGCGSVHSLVLHHDVTQLGWEDIRILADTIKACGIHPKLMMTESCYGGCAVRQAHYAYVAQPVGKRTEFDPFQVSCMLKRLTDPSSLLDLAGFMMPEELHAHYKKSGIEGFKITGRSCSAHWVERTCRHYLSGWSPANLFDLIVFTAPYLREKFSMNVEDLFFVDSQAYWEFVAYARDLRAKDREVYSHETAARLFQLGLLRVNDPGAIYQARNGRLALAVPGEYSAMLRSLLVEGAGAESKIKIANVVVGGALKKENWSVENSTSSLNQQALAPEGM